MRIVSHEITRGSRYVTYKDDEPDFGFSWRAAYHRGNAPPNYPVPVDMDTAMTSLFHQREIINWSVPYMERKLRQSMG